MKLCRSPYVQYLFILISILKLLAIRYRYFTVSRIQGMDPVSRHIPIERPTLGNHLQRHSPLDSLFALLMPFYYFSFNSLDHSSCLRVKPQFIATPLYYFALLYYFFSYLNICLFNYSMGSGEARIL